MQKNIQGIWYLLLATIMIFGLAAAGCEDDSTSEGTTTGATTGTTTGTNNTTNNVNNTTTNPNNTTDPNNTNTTTTNNNNTNTNNTNANNTNANNTNNTNNTTPACGNGVVEGSEQCDNVSGCRPDCTWDPAICENVVPEPNTGMDCTEAGDNCPNGLCAGVPGEPATCYQLCFVGVCEDICEGGGGCQMIPDENGDPIVIDPGLTIGVCAPPTQLDCEALPSEANAGETCTSDGSNCTGGVCASTPGEDPTCYQLCLTTEDSDGDECTSCSGGDTCFVIPNQDGSLTPADTNNAAGDPLFIGICADVSGGLACPIPLEANAGQACNADGSNCAGGICAGVPGEDPSCFQVCLTDGVRSDKCGTCGPDACQAIPDANGDLTEAGVDEDGAPLYAGICAPLQSVTCDMVPIEANVAASCASETDCTQGICQPILEGGAAECLQLCIPGEACGICSNGYTCQAAGQDFPGSDTPLGICAPGL